MFSINCKGRLLSLHQPVVMGIINATPDSFYAGSRTTLLQEVVARVEKMMEEGVTIVDVGGQSTRPQSQRVEVDEELMRVIPIIEGLSQKFPQLIISIDTFYAKVARYAVESGAAMINDVSAGTIDEALLPTVAALEVPYVLMHMKGDPQTMQQQPTYDHVVLEIFDFLVFKMHELKQMGIKDIILDPGFGFGKTAAHNFEILNNLSFLNQLERPLLVGLSRKATIYKTLHTTAENALNGTTVLNTISLLQGASILRVHDVKEAVEAIQLIHQYNKQTDQL